jgi:hypothetical protein
VQACNAYVLYRAQEAKTPEHEQWGTVILCQYYLRYAYRNNSLLGVIKIEQLYQYTSSSQNYLFEARRQHTQRCLA